MAGGVLFHSFRFKDCRLGLGAGEAVADLATSRPRLASVEVDESCTLLGYYQSYNRFCKRSSKGRCARRITGGATLFLEAPWSYTVLAYPGSQSLREVYETGRRLAECLYQVRVSGSIGATRNTILVLGATRIGRVGLVEIASSTEPVEPPLCIRELGFGSLEKASSLPERFIETRAQRYGSDTWNKYSFKPLTGESRICSREGFWARLGVEIVDGYIAGWSLEGNFYSAPPPEIYSILASAKGTPFHELTLDNIKWAIRERLEVYGLDTRDVIRLVENLYEKHGYRHYTG